MRTLKVPNNNLHLSFLQSQYDVINQEESSSHPDSLLVSPHSRISRPSLTFKQSLFTSPEQSNSKFRKPFFETQNIHETESKKKTHRYGQNYNINCEKITEPDLYNEETDRTSGLQTKIQDLITLIKKKDQRILELQVKLRQRQPLTLIKQNFQQKITTSHQLDNTKMQCLRKQVLFLTQNNLQLFQEVHRLNLKCQEFKDKFNSTQSNINLLKSQVNKLTKLLKQQQLANFNLIKQKKQMIENYEEQIKLFLKMKKVWESSQEPETMTTRSKSNRGKGKRSASKFSHQHSTSNCSKTKMNEFFALPNQ